MATTSILVKDSIGEISRLFCDGRLAVQAKNGSTILWASLAFDVTTEEQRAAVSVYVASLVPAAKMWEIAYTDSSGIRRYARYTAPT